MITIITPCCRPSRLPELYSSIRFDKIKEWIIVYDTSRSRKYTHQFTGHTQIRELECDHEGSAGHPQRNYAIDYVKEGYIYFLDDDNIMHPTFWDICDTFDGAHYYTWDQIRDKKGAILRGNICKVNNIDTAQFIVPYELYGTQRWEPKCYYADGIFIETLHKKYPNLHKYIPIQAAYYNYLTT